MIMCDKMPSQTFIVTVSLHIRSAVTVPLAACCRYIKQTRFAGASFHTMTGDTDDPSRATLDSTFNPGVGGHSGSFAEPSHRSAPISHTGSLSSRGTRCVELCGYY